MWPTVLHAVTTAAAWPWLAPLTTLTQAATALISLADAVHRARRPNPRHRVRNQDTDH